MKAGGRNLVYHSRLRKRNPVCSKRRIRSKPEMPIINSMLKMHTATEPENINKRMNLRLWALLALSGVLLFVFTLPNAIALRKLLLVTAFLVSAGAFWAAMRQRQNELAPALMIYALLQIWMFCVALFIADQAAPSLLEWIGQWLTPTLSLAIGIGLAAMIMSARLRNPMALIALTVAAPITLLLVLNDAVALYDMARQRVFITHHNGITDHTANIGYAIALLEPLLIADILSRIAKRGRLLPVPVLVSNIVLVIAIFALVSASSRNGLLTILLAFVLGGIMMLSELRKAYPPKQVATAFLIGAIFIAGYITVSIKSDPRWQYIFETAPIAWDIDKDTRWLDGENLPLTPSGEPVEASAYLRIAWAHEAWRMLLTRPWGTEISRETFHRLEVAKHGHAGMAHSHNGWLDFGLNFGFPGLALWSAFLFLLARAGWRAWQERRDPLGFALMLLVVMFAFRALLDSIFRNHMIEQFMLVAGLLAGAITFRKRGGAA